MKKSKLIIIIIFVAFIFGVVGFFAGKSRCEVKEKCTKEKEVEKTDNDKKEEKENKIKKNLKGKTFIRTYNINHIAPSNDYDYLYITIRRFQDEEIETVKVKREYFGYANVNDNYEIEFVIKNNEIEDNIKSIFANTEIISIEKTDKTGLEQINEEIE